MLAPAPALAQAEEPDAVLVRIRERLLYARYRDAIVDAYELLDRTDLGARQRNAALELLATAQVADRDEAGARSTLRTLYARDPGHRLTDPDASPPVQSAFARARQTPVDRVPVRLEHDAASAASTPQAPEIRVRIAAGADAVDQVRLSFRPAGEARFVRLEMPIGDGDVARARLPAVRGSEPVLVDYYIEALAPSLAALATIGTEASPLQLRIDPTARTATPTETVGPAPLRSAVVATPGATEPAPIAPTPEPPPESGGILSQWWFWTGLAVIAAGVTVVAVSSGSEDRPTGSLGAITLD